MGTCGKGGVKCKRQKTIFISVSHENWIFVEFYLLIFIVLMVCKVECLFIGSIQCACVCQKSGFLSDVQM